VLEVGAARPADTTCLASCFTLESSAGLRQYNVPLRSSKDGGTHDYRTWGDDSSHNCRGTTTCQLLAYFTFSKLRHSNVLRDHVSSKLNLPRAAYRTARQRPATYRRRDESSRDVGQHPHPSPEDSVDGVEQSKNMHIGPLTAASTSEEPVRI
jgi:hypothetical protein